jgi:hypothetical protein
MRIVAATLALIIATSPLMADEGRTFVDRLPLDTPESTVTAFIEAFATKDYATAYYMMSPEAKHTFIDSYYAFTVGRYFKADEDGMIKGSIYSDMADMEEGLFEEVSDDTALIFDNIVFNADANGQMPFRIADATIGTVEKTGDDAALVTLEGAKPASLRLEAVLLFNGDWRIDRIFWDGSDPELRPWGLGQGKVKQR